MDTWNELITGDPRSAKVIATIESGDGFGIYLNKYYELQNYHFVRDMQGYILEIGHFGDFSVTINVEYWKINGQYVVMWHNSGRYADYNIHEEWLKKLYANAKVHVGISNIRKALDLIKEDPHDHKKRKY
jgi:hypothetical protein